MAEPAVVRAVGFYGPLALVMAASALKRPDRRRAGAALLAGLWNLTALLAVNVVALRVGWWAFGTTGGELVEVPVDLLLGWALLWGVLPALLAGRVPAFALVVALLWADLMLMPLGRPTVVLGEHWLAGEALAMATALVPGLVLARLTVGRRRLAVRVAMQFVLFGALAGGVATVAVLGATGGSAARVDLRRPLVPLVLQGIFILALPALAAVRELAGRGGGTPFPYDPPARLVTTGPYAYVANPMQLSMTATLLAWGALLGSWGIVGLAFTGAAFAAGIAGWHESVELGERHGAAWPAYRRHVAAWRPRRRPWAGEAGPAVLYVAPGCEPCQGVGRWISQRRPVGLDVRPATDAPRPLTRLGYLGPDGHGASGVAAFARALEHVHLGWALLAWALLLPGVGRFVQLVVDAMGGGPRREPIGVLPQGDGLRRRLLTGADHTDRMRGI
jgi:protein-S-isoprenylcysteine O-methyltransferase Ste14